MNESQIIVAVTTCPQNEQRIQAVQDTWLSAVSAKTVKKLFVYGNDGKACPRMESDRVFLNCPEAYEHLSLKTYKLCQYCLENEDFDFLIKCDDDVFVDLEALLLTVFANADYVGWTVNPDAGFNQSWHHGKCSIPGTEIPYRGDVPSSYVHGFCYILSRKAVRWIAGRPIEWIKGCLYEDVMVGAAIERANVTGECPLKVESLPRDRLCHGNAAAMKELSAAAWARHPVGPDEMRTAYKVWKDAA